MKQAIVALAGTVDPVVVEELVAALRGGRKNCSACLQGVARVGSGLSAFGALRT
jgi:hypothetical protein